RHRPVVVRLARANPGRDGVREGVVDPRSVDPGAAGADPAVESARDVWQDDVDGSSQRLPRVRATLHEPGVRLDRDPREAAPSCLDRNGPVRLDTDEAPVRGLDLGEQANLAARRAEPES